MNIIGNFLNLFRQLPDYQISLF